MPLPARAGYPYRHKARPLALMVLCLWDGHQHSALIPQDVFPAKLEDFHLPQSSKAPQCKDQSPLTVGAGVYDLRRVRPSQKEVA